MWAALMLFIRTVLPPSTSLLYPLCDTTLLHRKQSRNRLVPITTYVVFLYLELSSWREQMLVFYLRCYQCKLRYMQKITLFDFCSIFIVSFQARLIFSFYLFGDMNCWEIPFQWHQTLHFVSGAMRVVGNLQQAEAVCAYLRTNIGIAIK